MRIIAAAAVPRRDVKETIGAKTNLATVVIPVRLRDFEEDTLGLALNPIAIARRNSEFADDAAFWVLLAVINKNAAIASELRMTREAEQPLLVLHEWLTIDEVKKFL